MLRSIKRFLFALPLTVLFVTGAKANTYTAASCNTSDVQAAVNQAANGDTVTIPACPSGVAWTSALTVTKGISIIGQGAGSTVLVDNTSKGDSNCEGTTPLISVSLSSNVFVRVSGFTINGAPRQYNCGESANHIAISGSTHQFRVDDIVFNLQVTGVSASGDVWGVIDHNTFNDAADVFPVEVHHDSWQGIGGYGDNSWAQPDTLGQAGAVYIEDNTFSFTNSAMFPVGCFDSEAGGRLVFRHNTGCPFVGAHGLDSSGRWRSVRQYEIYSNTFTAQANPNANMYTGVFLRGGTGMIFNNTFNDNGPTPYITLVQVNNYRDTNGVYFPWGPNYSGEGCDGRGPFDTNAGTVYASGSYNGASGTKDLLTDTTQAWAASKWTGYSIVDTSVPWGSAIDSSTTTTITSEPAQQGTAHSWNNGDSYQILKAYPCIDQIGRGQGSYISGDNPTPVGPVNQAADPLYEWNNAHNSSTVSAIASNNPQHVSANRDYYDWTGSFNGSSGVGTGALSARPATCTAGVGYWASDTNTLYQCTSANTWSAHYAPYTYPHPLIQGGTGGSGSSVNPPTGLAATVQ